MMGRFSWIYSDTKKPIMCGKHHDTYLLVPPEYQLKYGMYIYEGCYDGYGHFSGYDAYELVAEWNKGHVDISRILTDPRLEDYRCNDAARRMKWFTLAEKRYAVECQMLNDYYRRNTLYSDMVAAYGSDFLREIGILLACDDEMNASLYYPLKFVSQVCSYAQAVPSIIDPNQGCC